jgi:hypothetical protein
MFRLSPLLLCAAGVVSAAGRPAEDHTSVSQAKAALARLPLRFEANRGQAPPQVRYVARAGGYTLALTSAGPTVHVPGSKAVTISLVNSKRAPRMEALEPLTLRTDYFVGSRDKWRTAVPSYARVRYHEVYPGIDVVYYGNQNMLEYDFVLRPGAAPEAIRLKFRGPGNVAISPEGDLVLASGGVRIIQKKPFIYQEDSRTGELHEVGGGYKLLGRNLVGLKLDRYDRGSTLVIDPVLTYSTYVGGTGTDQINAAKLGPNNRLYITGSTNTEAYEATGTAYYWAKRGFTDAFLAIFDMTPGGDFPMVYYGYLGGTALNVAYALDVDANGVAYITGDTTSTDFPIAGNALQTTGASATTEGFVTKIDPSKFWEEALVYSSYLGGSDGADSGRGISVDASGVMYIIGNTRSTDFPLTESAPFRVMWGPQEVFITIIDSVSGDLRYSTYLGGESSEDGNAILVAPNGLVYFAITTVSTYFPVSGFGFNPFIPAAPGPAGSQDPVFGVIDPSKAAEASLVYSTFLGGSGNDEARGIAFDGNGNLLVTGYTMSTDFPVTTNAMQPTNNGNADAFVALVNPARPAEEFLSYSTYLGGANGDVGYDIKADSAGNIYVTGYTLSGDFPILNAPQPEWGAGIDVFLTKFRPGVSGREAISYSTYFGAAGVNLATALAVAADGTAYVAGYGNTGMPVPRRAYSGGASDGFVLVVAQ